MRHILELKEVAMSYYMRTWNPTLLQGNARYVLVNQEVDGALFVSEDYSVQEGDVVFRCEIKEGDPIATLLRKG